MPNWDVKTVLVNSDNELRKVTGVCEGKTFFMKAKMKTPDEQKAVYDNLWDQYLESIEVVSDKFADDTKSDLQGRTVP